MTTNVQQVQIQIDGTKYESPALSTGAALYVLGRVKPDYDLYKEIRGQGDDDLIPNTAAKIEVEAGDQFYSAKRTLNPGA